MAGADQVIEFCVDVLAHADQDMEITINGNGYQGFELAGLAEKILGLLGLTDEQVRDAVYRRSHVLYMKKNGW